MEMEGSRFQSPRRGGGRRSDINNVGKKPFAFKFWRYVPPYFEWANVLTVGTAVFIVFLAAWCAIYLPDAKQV